MPGDGVVGSNCKAYYNSATHASPTWVEITDAIDIGVDLSKVKADVSSRAGTWKHHKSGQKEGSISMSYLHNKGADTVFDALLASYISDTPRQFAFMDGAIATAANQGLRAYCEVFGMSQGQNLDDGVKYDFELGPTRFLESSVIIQPTWFEVAL